MKPFSKLERQIAELLTAHGEMHGMALVREGKGRLKRGSVYVTLQRMQDRGFVTARDVTPTPPQRGPHQRHYKLSLLGRRTLEGMRLAERFLKTGTV